MTGNRILGPLGTGTEITAAFPDNAVEYSRYDTRMRLRVIRSDTGASIFYAEVGGVIFGFGPEAGITEIDLSTLFKEIPAGVPLRLTANLGGQTSDPLDDVVFATAEAVVAPTNNRAPAIVPPLYIDQPAKLDIGDWNDMDVGSYGITWLVDGVPAAEVAEWTPGQSANLLPGTARVKAENAAGELELTTAPVVITNSPPIVYQELDDVVADQGDPAIQINGAAAFVPYVEDGTELDLPAGVYTFSVTGAGATINPTTGLVTIPTTAVLAGVNCTVTATTSGGSISETFSVTVVLAGSLPAFPAQFDLALFDAGEVRDSAPDEFKRRCLVDGSVTVPAGFTLEWSSSEAAAGDPRFTTTLTPGVEEVTSGTKDLGAEMYEWAYWKRTADGAMQYAIAEPLTYTMKGIYPQPTLVDPLDDVIAVKDDPQVAVDLVAAFYPDGNAEGCTFSVVSGVDYVLDAPNGKLYVQTLNIKTAQPITVRATTVGGSTDDTFNVTITAAAGTTPFPANILPTNWITAEERDSAPEGRVKVTVTGMTIPAGFDLCFSPTENPDGVPEWSKPQTVDVTYTTKSESLKGTKLYLMMFWRRDEDGAYQLAHPASEKRTLTIQGLKEPPVSGTFPSIPEAVVQQAIGYNLFYNTHNGKYYGVRNPANELHAPQILACRLLHGPHAGAKSRLLAQLRSNLNANKDPMCLGGYTQQYDFITGSYVALAKAIPDVWSSLTASERSRFDVMMEAILYCGGWSAGDGNPRTKAGLSMKDFLGYSGYGRGWAPNFHTGMIGSVLVAIPYFGGPQAVKSLMDGFSLSAFRSRLNDANLTNAKLSYSGIGKASGAPSEADVKKALTNFTYFDFGLPDILGMVERNSAKSQWSQPICTGHGGTAANNWIGPGIDTPSDGVRGKLRNKSDYAGLPNKGVKAMSKELFSKDAISQRSSMSYAFDSGRLDTSLLTTLAAAGYLNRTMTGIATTMGRYEMGWEDLEYKTKHPYDSWAKGGGGASEDWNLDRCLNKFGGAMAFAQRDWILGVLA